MKNILTFLSVFLLLCSLKLTAQTEYLVKLDLATGTIEKVKKIDGVAYVYSANIIYDQVHGYYSFVGTDATQLNTKLYTIDVKTGNVISKPPFLYANKPTNWIYNAIANKVYAYYYDNLQQVSHVVSIDRTNGIYGDFFTFSNSNMTYGYLDGGCYDAARNKYYLYSASARLYTLDLNNQAAAYTSFTITNGANYFYGMEYDATLDKLICLHQDFTTKASYLGTVNPSNGIVSSMALSTNIKNMAFSGALARHGYDPKRHYLIFNALDANGQERLFTIDATNGNIIYSPLFPQTSPGDNLIYPKCDTTTGIVYALYWENPTAPVCNAPDTVYTAPYSDSTALVYWNNVSGVTDYEYYVAPSPSTPPAHGTPVSGTLGFTPALQKNKKYDVCVRSVCDTNLTSAWVCTNITLKTVGIDNINMQAAQVYPNPVKENLTIDKAAGSFATLYNITGQQLYQTEIKNVHHRIDMAHFSAGIYILQLRDVNGITTVRKLQKE